VIFTKLQPSTLVCYILKTVVTVDTIYLTLTDLTSSWIRISSLSFLLYEIYLEFEITSLNLLLEHVRVHPTSTANNPPHPLQKQIVGSIFYFINTLTWLRE